MFDNLPTLLKHFTVAETAIVLNIYVHEVRRAMDNPPVTLCNAAIHEIQSLYPEMSNPALAKMYCTTLPQINSRKWSKPVEPPHDEVIKADLLSGKHYHDIAKEHSIPRSYVMRVRGRLIIELMPHHSQVVIAEMLGVTLATVNRYNSNRTSYKQLSDHEWHHLEEFAMTHNIAETARQFGVSRTTIYNKRNRDARKST